MLTVCDNPNHENICFEGSVCPLCCALAEKIRADRERDNALGEAAKLQAKVEEMLK